MTEPGHQMVVKSLELVPERNLQVYTQVYGSETPSGAGSRAKWLILMDVQ